MDICQLADLLENLTRVDRRGQAGRAPAQLLQPAPFEGASFVGNTQTAQPPRATQHAEHADHHCFPLSPRISLASKDRLRTMSRPACSAVGFELDSPLQENLHYTAQHTANAAEALLL